MSASAATNDLQTSGMLSREQLLYLFNRFSVLTSLSDVKKRIADAVRKDKQEAVAVTTAIQEEILLEMELVYPRFGIACLGKVNMIYENDQDLMIRFYGFVAKEEMACDEAELEPDEFAEKMRFQHKLQEEQLEMLKHMRKFHKEDQSAILEMLRQQMENANFENSTAILNPELIQEIIRKKISPSIKTS
ncbi:uncharacterized protein LOC122078801 [Macadamia integrifolia]|uniref:uncharacterized protein LOC122078801 n=1 Tax=Macadamia integrifolia TaxID=60698 RepID=UPI001C4E4655|nr:uncharacterized protein LOC122078801 [Macadamia integrifolia]